MAELQFNKIIDSFLMQARWEIDADWGQAQLACYLEDLAFVANGGEYSDLGYSQRREEQRPVVVSTTGEVTRYSGGNQTPQHSIAHLKLSGVMRMRDSLSTRGVDALFDDFRTVNSDPNIDGIILEVNSGGGESMAGHFLNTVIRDSKKPVVVWGHLVGSAAMNAVAPAARIILSSRGSEIGSIGTMVSVNKSYMQWYKDNYMDIYSKKSPAKNKAWRDMLAGRNDSIIEEIEHNVDAFHANIKEHRILNADLMQDTLSGAMFIGEEGIRRGLADSIGTFTDALNEVRTLVGVGFNNQNNITMDFKNAFQNVIGALNSFFGWNHDANTTAEQIQGELAGFGKSYHDAVAVAVASGVSELSQSLEAVREQLTASQSIITTLREEITGLQGQITTLTERVAALSEENQRLSEERTALEKTILTLQGREDMENIDTPYNSTAKEFQDALGRLAIAGESKY